MELKNLWGKTSGWFKEHKLSKPKDHPLQIDDDGLINPLPGAAPAEQQADQTNSVVVKQVEPETGNESLEKLQTGFNKLVEQLEGINGHLKSQATQNEILMKQMNKLPELITSFPAVVENQKQLTEQLFEQLKANAFKGQQFIDAVEKIPTETAKQTDALAGIDHQLAAAADTDVQMVESFNKFNEILGKLNQSTVGQTDGIMQMSKTFATSDRYLKYLITRQNKRFMWIFMTAIGVCLLVILMLTGIIIYLRQ